MFLNHNLHYLINANVYAFPWAFYKSQHVRKMHSNNWNFGEIRMYIVRFLILSIFFFSYKNYVAQCFIRIQKYFNNIVFKKNVALWPPEGPENLKTPKDLYRLLLHFWTKFCSNAAVLLSLYSKEKLMFPLPLGRQ